uniref:tRNA-dihydrouridine synthase n=1 Tax=Parastrongyloides trichosuri TaxID=131310 RepID=A0A0N4ZRT2_PARTI
MNQALRKEIENDFNSNDLKVPLFVLAPMVRYSKLVFRLLVSEYGADVCYTPMIFANCFSTNKRCTIAEFTTIPGEKPIVQFAADNAEDFAYATELIYKDSSGVDLNCGCPKKSVTSKKCGSALLKNPELISDILKQTRNKICDDNFIVSCKIRIDQDVRRTVDLAKKLEAAGINRIAIHGRTKEQASSEPCNYETIRLIKDSINIPVFANGGVTKYEDLINVARITKADGIMVANGLLENPALFCKQKYPSLECIKSFINLESKHGLIYDLFHQHLIFMMRHMFSKPERLYFNELRDIVSVKSYLNTYIDY